MYRKGGYVIVDMKELLPKQDTEDLGATITNDTILSKKWYDLARKINEMKGSKPILVVNIPQAIAPASGSGTTAKAVYRISNDDNHPTSAFVYYTCGNDGYIALTLEIPFYSTQFKVLRISILVDDEDITCYYN